MYKGYLTDIHGIEVGHYEDYRGLTGCTAIVCREGAVGGVCVRGSGPGTRETDIFDQNKTVDIVHGIVLSGGSAFGLNAAGGLMNYLEEENIGFDVEVTKVPIVPAAVIFDLQLGDYKIRPDEKMGYKAGKNASSQEKRQGNIGAGTGATVGKYLGAKNAMKSGLGSATLEVGDLKVSALVVVNAVGDIYDLNNKQIAGIYNYEENSLVNSMEILKKGQIENNMLTNTTIGIIASNAKLDKAKTNKVAEMAHNGYAKVINPIHTSLDGDTIFALSTGQVEASVDLVGSLAAEVMAKAIINGVKSAQALGGLKSYEDIK